MKLGIRKVSLGTIARILKEQGLDPGPKRCETTWDQFVKAHAKTLYAWDFFTKSVWTLKGRVEMYMLAFLHVGSRRVWVSQATAHPTAAWVEQQARNVCMTFQEQDVKPTYLIRDGDAKYTRHFDAIFKAEGVEVQRLPRQSPNLNAHVERFVRSVKGEALDHFVVFGAGHLNHIVAEYVEHYHTERAHRATNNRPPLRQQTQGPTPAPNAEQVVCRERLGGLLRHYERRAAA